MTLSSLEELERRLASAKEPDRGLDAEIYTLHWNLPCVVQTEVRYTESLDAAVAFAETMLPGCVWHIMTDYGDLKRAKVVPAGASVYRVEENALFMQADAETPALALTLAIVRALIAKEAPHA